MTSEAERGRFEDFARFNKMSLTRNALKPDEYAFGTQKAWLAWQKIADSARIEIERLEKLVYVPGVLKCAKCGFSLMKTTLYVRTGQFGADNSPDYCPNDGAPMWRVTERDAGNELVERLHKEITESAVLRRLPVMKEDEAVLKMFDAYYPHCHMSVSVTGLRAAYRAITNPQPPETEKPDGN